MIPSSKRFFHLDFLVGYCFSCLAFGFVVVVLYVCFCSWCVWWFACIFLLLVSGFLLHMVVGKWKISLHYFLGILLLGCDSVWLKKKKRFGRNLEGFWRWVLMTVVLASLAYFFYFILFYLFLWISLAYFLRVKCVKEVLAYIKSLSAVLASKEEKCPSWITYAEHSK